MLSDKRLRHEVCRNVLTHRGLYIEERDAIFCRDYSIQNLAVYMLAMTELLNRSHSACYAISAAFDAPIAYRRSIVRKGHCKLSV